MEEGEAWNLEVGEGGGRETKRFCSFGVCIVCEWGHVRGKGTNKW